ncbi:diphthamide biosynthesis enzyme Dph2 [Candidatus Micrarchaeota archaeon]|nr:diphthamide biosynthesis enzyme Dph2 [Candidatus Micrarchaeota archaeon]
MGYDFELDRVKRELTAMGAKSCMVQLPEGLKQFGPQIAGELEKAGFRAVISLERCFGACDVLRGGYDATLHYAHAPYARKEPKTVYVELRQEADAGRIADSAEHKLRAKNVGLVTTIQFLNVLPKLKQELEKRGFAVEVGKRGHYTYYDGQVLGCDFFAATNCKKAQEFIYVGSGRFHPIGVAEKTGKRVVQVNPNDDYKAQEFASGIWEKEKWLRISKASDARSWGIVLCSKKGQRNVHAADNAKRWLEEKGRKATLLELNDIIPQALEYAPFDAFVITACPRIVLDDWKNYKKPVLLAEEIKELLS